MVNGPGTGQRSVPNTGKEKFQNKTTGSHSGAIKPRTWNGVLA